MDAIVNINGYCVNIRCQGWGDLFGFVKDYNQIWNDASNLVNAITLQGERSLGTYGEFCQLNDRKRGHEYLKAFENLVDISLKENTINMFVDRNQGFGEFWNENDAQNRFRMLFPKNARFVIGYKGNEKSLRIVKITVS